MKKTIINQAMDSLFEILHGIRCDASAPPREYASIYNWMNEYDEYKQCDVLSGCYKILNEILEDNYISLLEYEHLMAYIISKTRLLNHSDENKQ